MTSQHQPIRICSRRFKSTFSPDYFCTCLKNFLKGLDRGGVEASSRYFFVLSNFISCFFGIRLFEILTHLKAFHCISSRSGFFVESFFHFHFREHCPSSRCFLNKFPSFSNRLAGVLSFFPLSFNYVSNVEYLWSFRFFLCTLTTFYFL